MEVQGIRVIDDVVNECEEIVSWIENQNSWQKAMLMNEKGGDLYSNTNVRSCDVMFVPIISFDQPSIIHNMNKSIWQVMNDYAVDFMFSFDNIEPVSINRYKPGQDFKSHEDRQSKGDRILSGILYLNDVEEGGETIFDFFNYSVSPKAGRVVLFPSFFLFRHTALSPISGNKYSAAYWGTG